jgi:transposase-like protein
MKKMKTHDSVFKAKVALESVRGEKTITHISSEYGVHQNQISKWKKKLLHEMPESGCKQGITGSGVISSGRANKKVELEWV